MKRRITVRELKAILREAVLREEADDANELPQETGDSLDSQVDRYLGQYESEAKTSKSEGLDFRAMTRRFLIEAGQDDDAGEEEPANDAGGEDLGLDLGGGDSAADDGKLSLDNINIESFADSVVRLITNYDNLLEVQSTLIKRAKNFLGKAYDVEVVDAFEKVLRENHGMAVGESKSDIANDDFAAPGADRAGEGPPGVGGGSGAV